MTAEAAAVLPVLVLFAMALVWGLLTVGAQLQCVDAARTGARAAARQDPPDEVVRVTGEAAPRGAAVTVSRGEGQVRVGVVARPPGLGALPIDLREEAVAAAEEGSGEGPGEGTAEATVAAMGEGAARRRAVVAPGAQKALTERELGTGEHGSHVPGEREGRGGG